MKKLSFFLMAMLISLVSFAAEATATISFADKAQRTVYTTSQQVWEQNGIVVTNDKASSTTNVGDYANPARFYKGSKVTIQCTLGNIKQIEITGWGDSKYNVWATSIGSEAAASGSSVIITPTAVSDTYVANMTGGQARAGQMVVTYEVSDEGFVATPAIEGEPYFKESATVSMKAAEGLKVYYTLDGTDPTTASAEYTAPFEVTETTTVKAIAHDGENASDVVTVVFKKMEVLTPSEAAAITPTGDKYIVRGYVTSSNEYSTQYNNIDFFVADTKDGGEVLKVYRAVAVTEEDKAVKVGDYVEVIGVLAAYYETIQIAQGGTYTIIPEPAPEPVMETVYFVNAGNWTTVNVYAWTTDPNASWPGVAATKEAEQIAGYDVYSYTAEAGKYANVIFNNGSGAQTADLVWTAGKYYVKDGWYTKEEAEAQLAKPVEYESVYFVDNQGWGKANIYTWTPEVGTWPGVAMTKEVEQLAGYDVYSYTVEKGTSFGGVIFNNGSGVQTGDLKWTAGKYYVKDAWYTKEEAIEKLSGPVTPPVITYVLMGVKGDWKTGIAMTQNPDNANEYVLLGQEILEGDSVKVVTLTDGVATAWCGNVDEYSPVEYTNAEGNGNIVLAPGKYDFYYKVAEDLIYIGGEAYAPEYALEETVEISNLTTETLTVGEATYLQLTGRNDMLDSDVQLFLNNYTGEDKEYEVNVENSLMTFGGIELTVVEGKIAQATDPEKGKLYTGRVIASAEEEGEVMLVALDLVMFSTPAVEVAIENATARVDEETGSLVLNAEWTKDGVTYPVFVYVAGYEDVEFKEYEGAQISELQIGDDDNWLDFAVANVVAVIKEGQNISIEGEYTSWATGTTYALTISGQLPKVEEPDPVKPEPTYTENNLNPYAFGLESVLSDDKTTLTVTYRLNNSNATSVNVVVYNGEDIVALVPGTTTIGKNTVEVATGDLPAGVELKWAVEVNGTSVEAPTAESKIYSFYHPSGLDIDINPENPTFGMLLVNEGMHSVKDKTEGYVSAQFGAGIFAFTPSFDLIPNGELPGYNGGIEFTTTRADGTGTAYSPRRIRISEDGRIFVTSLNTDGNYLWEVNADNLNEWTPVFKGTLNDQRELITEDSAFIAAPNNGFDVKGSGENLQLAMYSVNLSGITAAAMSGFRLHEYNLGTATEWATAPSKTWVEGLYAINYTGTQVEYDNEGGLWICSYRGSATDANPGLVHINAAGVEDAKLVWNNVRQAGIRFNKDFTKLVVAGNNGAAKKATIYTISKDANGAPVLTQEAVIDMAVVGNNLNDFAWDYAGNLYSCGNSAEKLAAWAMPYSGKVETPAAAKYAFQLPEPLKMAGVVKRAIQNGEDVIVLTHEADGTAHIYQVVDGKPVAELSQEGVIARDPENAGDLLAISDIAVTEDGKLVAVNSMVCQSAEDYVDAGYKRGETRFYIWNELDADPTVWFKSNMYGNWFRSKEGGSMAIKGTSTNAQIMVTSIHATKYWSRFSVYSVIDGVYNEPADAATGNEHYTWCEGPAAGDLDENVLGVQYELNASATAGNWIVDAELANPIEFVQPATIKEVIATLTPLTEDLGKKYNGASYVTVGEKVLMVAPFANPDGQLVGAEILNITNGFDAPQYVDMVYVDEAVAVTAAATAVEVVEGGLNITLVADNAIHTWFVEMSEGPVSEVYEEEITNLVIDLDNLLLIGGPSTAFQVEVVLGLGEYNRNDDTYQLLPESSIAVMGSDATFIDGYAYEVDAFTPSAKAVVHCEWNGMLLEFRLTMSAAPMEATKVVVENAAIEIEKYLLFGDMYDYSLKMTGVWHNEEDGLDYPVLVEVPVYYPEATEPSEIMSTVTVGGWEDDDPWLGFGEGTLTVTTETLSSGDKLITATGIVQNPMAGVAIDITISGSTKNPGLGLENTTVTVKPVKMIQNGQLIIEKDGVQYNAQGATLK